MILKAIFYAAGTFGFIPMCNYANIGYGTIITNLLKGEWLVSKQYLEKILQLLVAIMTKISQKLSLHILELYTAVWSYYILRPLLTSLFL